MFFRRSLFVKMFVNAMAVLVAYSIIVAGGVQFYITRVQLNRTTAALGENAEQAHEILESFASEECRRELGGLSFRAGVIIVVRDKDGALLYNISQDIDPERFSQDRLIKIQTNRTYLFERLRGDTEATYITCVASFDNYTVYIRQSMQSLNDYIISVQRITFWFVIIAVFISIFWALGYSRWFTRPISLMNTATRRLAALEFDSKITLDRDDEVGQLADSINVMSSKLATALAELKEKNEQLTAELERERALENMRKKFVSDVSHELKTPLAIIQGYAEAMERNAAKSATKLTKYTAAIMDETQRMNRLVLDLLDLSNYQSGKFALKCRSFDIDALLCKAAEKHTTIADAADVRILAEAQPFVAHADPDRIEQVLSNVISNAVSHCDKGNEISVRGCVTDDGKYRITVFNSGNHINETDLPNIWTPFYRADIARSRSSGRYGIGLSIVKALLELHGAEFGLNNVAGGVEFYCVLEGAPARNHSGQGQP